MRNTLLFLLTVLAINVFAQENLPYQKPSQEILELVDVPLAPSVILNNDNSVMLLLYRDAYKSIEELSQEELRLGGLRIDPAKNIGSRTTYYNNLKIRFVNSKNKDAKQVTGLPDNPRLSGFAWSHDQSKIAVLNNGKNGVSVWVVDIETATAKQLTDEIVNANMRNAINWFKDNSSMLVKVLPKDRKELVDTKTAVPAGPTISVSEGKKAQNRTYQDLLKNKNDEFNFEQLALSELVKVNIEGSIEPWLGSDMYTGVSFSPDGNYIMVTTIDKPFSYLVPYYRFPSETIIYTKDGKAVQSIVKVPLIEDLPKGFMSTRTGRRGVSWRSDRPSTIIFAEALDGGDPQNEVDYRDEVYELEAPYDGEPVSLLKTINRFSGIEWGNDEIAIAYDYWWNTRNTKTYLFDPSDNTTDPIVLFDRSYQDRYNDPGDFVTVRNKYDKYVLALKKNKAFLIGDGYTPEGQFPFLDEFSFSSLKSKRLYQTEYTDKYESIREFDVENNRLLVRIESANEYPNYYFRNLKNKKLTQITDFKNPFKSIQDVHKEVITYKRDDGLELSGTLYLPVGYEIGSGEKMPMILWAYPVEFKDKSNAGQNTQNPNRFTYPYYGSPVYWLTKGYVILDDASFPIVGEGDEEPNDSFRKQLVANAKAAIDAVDELGYIDRERVACGGHSYGAFMVANLLSHSDLFAAGIARSGAYNRTLTPFGFQSEERSYWEAPEVYNTMSPFMHADKMKTPLLLIHGEADNNSGTYPMQSERYFNALKGLGATARLVILPKESHGYRAKESILHLLWEQDQWLEKYVKNK